jgi:hypothetical protein
MKKHLWIVLLFIGAVLCLTACKKKAEQAKVETIEGVTYVHNLATPLQPNKTVVFEEELAFKEKDETGEIRLFKPSSYAVDTQDNVYISDDSDLAIKVFDAQGKYLRSIGRRGNGPGEFESIYQMVFLPDGRLLITDYQLRRTSFFSPEGQFLSSFQWKKYYSRVYLFTNSTITLNEFSTSEQGTELWVKVIDFSGEELLSFGKFTFPEMKTIRVGDGAIATSVPWSPASVFVGDQKSQLLYHCLNDKYVIEVYDQQGKLIRKIDRPYEPMPVTEEDIEKYKSNSGVRTGSLVAKLREQMELPKVKTVTERLLVDDAGNLWVQTNEEKSEGEKTFTTHDIFNPDGFYESRVWLDLAPGLFANGKMYRMAEDEATGIRLPRRYRIIWKEATQNLHSLL